MARRDTKFLSRRRFLRGVGGVAVGLPLLESLREGPAAAAPVDGPARFLSFHCSSGVNTELFWPAIGRLSAASLAGTSMEVLAPLADRMLIPRGVHGYPVGTWSGHLEGTGQALTAAPIGPDELAQGTSIDQLIARQLTDDEAFVLKPGGLDRGVPAFNSISYTGAGRLATAEADPARAYQAMMGLTSSDGDPRSLARRSVLDLVKSEFDALQSIDLGADDRRKLEQHFELVRSVEFGLGAPAIACELAQADLDALAAVDPDQVELNANFPTNARLHTKIAALALACGYSPSVVLQWGAAVAGSPRYQWDGMNHAYAHHPLSHGTTEDFGGDEVADWQDLIAEIDRWNMAEFRALLDLLDTYAEADGRTLLDNTTVLYTNEFSHGQGHTTGDLPIVILGARGYFRLGESRLVDGSTPDIAGTTDPGNSNRMLRTVLDSVGVSANGFSDGPAAPFEELLV